LLEEIYIGEEEQKEVLDARKGVKQHSKVVGLPLQISFLFESSPSSRENIK
jgi:hypothetical protein